MSASFSGSVTVAGGSVLGVRDCNGSRSVAVDKARLRLKGLSKAIAPECLKALALRLAPHHWSLNSIVIMRCSPVFSGLSSQYMMICFSALLCRGSGADGAYRLMIASAVAYQLCR